jgi:Domain of unknown function (DUF6268)
MDITPESNDGDSPGALDLADGRMRIPFWGHRWENGTMMSGSLTYSWTQLGMDNPLGLSSTTLHALDLNLSLAHLPREDQGWMGLLILSPGVATDFDQITRDDVTLTAIGVLGYQISPSLSLAVAGYAHQAAGETTAFPGVGVLWKPTDTTIVQLTPPIVALGWNPQKDWTLSLAAYPTGSAWDVDHSGTDGMVEAIKFSAWRVGLGVEYRIWDHLRLTAQVGVNFGGEIELRDASERVLWGRDLEASPFGLIGAAWTF